MSIPIVTSLAQYSAAVGSTFYVEGRSIDLTLTEVEVVRDTPVQQTFTLLFSGPLEPMLGQGSYVLSHATIGQTEMFMGPLEKKAGRLIYQSTFNLLVQK